MRRQFGNPRVSSRPSRLPFSRIFSNSVIRPFMPSNPYSLNLGMNAITIRSGTGKRAGNSVKHYNNCARLRLTRNTIFEQDAHSRRDTPSPLLKSSPKTSILKKRDFEVNTYGEIAGSLQHGEIADPLQRTYDFVGKQFR